MKIRTLSSSACALLGLSSAVSAQGVGTAANGLEEVLVTAQKRSESLQDVPLSISAFGSEERTNLGITSISDIANFSPGVQYSSGLDRVSIRGIGRLIGNLAIESGVAVYYDGIYAPGTGDVGQSPLLVERVEVLRGPQGTLYGRNSIGGAMNVISKRPTQELSGEVRASYGSYQRRVFEGTLSGPITDWLGYRLSAVKTNQTEGYFRNVSGGPDEGGVTDAGYYEAQLQAKFADTFDIWLKYGFNEYTNAGRVDNLLAPYETVQVPATYTVPSPFWGLVQPTHTQRGSVTVNPAANGNIWEINTDTPRIQRLRHGENITLDATWHLSGMDLRYIGGKRKFEQFTQADYDSSPVTSYQYPGTNLTIYPTYITYTYPRATWKSHEINLTSTGDGRWQWLVGAYAYDEDSGQPLHIPAPNQPQFDTLVTYVTPFVPGTAVPTPQWPNPLRDIYYVDSDLNVKSRAAYAQTDFKFTDEWKATLGARYTQDHKTAEERTRQTCWAYASWCPTTQLPIDWTQAITPAAAFISPFEDGVVDNAYRDPVTGFFTRHLDKKWNSASGTASVQWKPVQDMLAYFTYSRGYKAGGFNAQSIQALPTIDPEHVNAFELGFKTEIGAHLQVNTAAYFYKYSDQQALIFIAPPDGGPGQNQLVNLDKTESKGFEFEANWRPFEDFGVLLNYAYLDPKITKACCFIDTNDTLGQEPSAKRVRPVVDGASLLTTAWAQDLAGQRVPMSPRNKVTANLNYLAHINTGTILFSGTYYWQDATYYSLFNRPYNRAPSFDRVDLQANWTDSSNTVSILLYVRNLLMKTGYDYFGGARQSLQFTQQYINPSATLGNLNYNPSYTPPRTFGVQVQYRFGAH